MRHTCRHCTQNMKHTLAKQCIHNLGALHRICPKGTASSDAQEQSITDKPRSRTSCWSSFEMHFFPLGLHAIDPVCNGMSIKQNCFQETSRTSAVLRVRDACYSYLSTTPAKRCWTFNSCINQLHRNHQCFDKGFPRPSIGN